MMMMMDSQNDGYSDACSTSPTVNLSSRGYLSSILISPDMILSAAASSPNVMARYDALPRGYTPLRQKKNEGMMGDIDDEDLLPLLRSASKHMLRNENDVSIASEDISESQSNCLALRSSTFDIDDISNNSNDIDAEFAYIPVVDVFKSVAAIWLLLFRIAYYMSRSYATPNYGASAPRSVFECLDSVILINADFAYDILLIVAGYLTSRPWYLYFLKTASENSNKILVIDFVKTYGRFLWSKFIRIAPIYFAGLTSIIVANYMLKEESAFSYCYDHFWRMVTFTSNQYSSQYCHGEYWFISLIVQLYTVTPIFVFLSFSTYLPFLDGKYKSSWLVRNALVILPILCIVRFLYNKYDLNMNVNSEVDILTSNSNVGDYSLFYRGGISYCVGVVISAITLRDKYTGKNGICNVQTTTVFANSANTSFVCCASAVIIPSVFIYFTILTGPGTNYTFGNWKRHVQIWVEESDPKDFRIIKLLVYRPLFTFSVGALFKHCIERTEHLGINQLFIPSDDDDMEDSFDINDAPISTCDSIISCKLWKIVARTSFLGFIFGHFVIISILSEFRDAEVAKNNDSVRVYSTFYAALILSTIIMLIIFTFAYTYVEKPLLDNRRPKVF